MLEPTTRANRDRSAPTGEQAHTACSGHSCAGVSRVTLRRVAIGVPQTGGQAPSVRTGLSCAGFRHNRVAPRGGRHTNACPGLSSAGAHNIASEPIVAIVNVREIRRVSMSNCRDIVVCQMLFAVVGFGYVVVFGMGRVLVCGVSGV